MRIYLAGLLACIAHLAFLCEQWHGAGTVPAMYGRIMLTATGIAPELHRTSLLITQRVNRICGKGNHIELSARKIIGGQRIGLTDKRE